MEKNKNSYPIKWKCFKNLGIKILDKWRLASDIQFFCNLKINATCFSNMYIKYNFWTAKSLKEKNVCCAKNCQYISWNCKFTVFVDKEIIWGRLSGMESVLKPPGYKFQILP